MKKTELKNLIESVVLEQIQNQAQLDKLKSKIVEFVDTQLDDDIWHSRNVSNSLSKLKTFKEVYAFFINNIYDNDIEFLEILINSLDS